MANYEEIQGGLGGLDPLDGPVPGQSLTTSPEQPRPYEQPPKYTDHTEASRAMFMQITEPKAMESLLNLMRADISIKEISQTFLFDMFRRGLINPDLMLGLIETTTYMMLWLADYADIDVRLKPDGKRIKDVTKSKASKEKLPEEIQGIARPEGLTEDLVTAAKQKVDESED